MLVLDGGKALTFEKFLVCLAKLMSGEGDAAALANQAEALALELGQVRLTERMGEAVRTMIDDRSQRTWHSASHAYQLGVIGLSRVADHVLVGLSVNRKSVLDPVEETVRRDAFQRNALELARSMDDVISGRVGEHGVVFLSGMKGSGERKKQKLLDLAERARTLARQRFGLSLHFGASIALGSVPLSRSYHAALGAAESALAQRTDIIFADVNARRPTESLRQLRQELSAGVEGHPERLGARFDRYLEAVAAHCGYRVETALGHLEAGFERLTDPLANRGSLDKKSLCALSDTLDRAGQEARTIGELFSSYRRAVQDVVAAVERPVAARQDRSLRVAIEYIHQHYTEQLRLEPVARMAGFTPNHFSRLFIKREEMPFEQYVRGLRIERARQLLSSTDANVTRVSELCGFNTPQYFCRVFRLALGVTPLEYRKNPRKVASSGMHKSINRNFVKYKERAGALR
jgi:AraC-like DNA-binding protein